MSRYEQEAREQSRVLAERTVAGREAAAAVAAILRRDDVEHLVVAARGTSDNAARYAQYLLGSRARIAVGLAAPWLYAAEAPPRLAGAAVLGISQSGRSPDIVRVLDAARRQGRPTAAITNDLDSPLAAAADVAVPLLAGSERSVPASKTYLASLHAIAQIATCLSPGADDDAWFARLPELVADAVEEAFTARSRFDRLDGVRLITAVGRGLQLPTAYETALKLRELSGIPAEAFSPPDLMHGPIAALHPSGAVWLVSTAGREQPGPDTFGALRRGAGVSVAVSDRPELVAAADVGVPIAAGLPEWVAPILAVIPGQAAALRLGELHGTDPDHPHGLQKITLTT